LLKVAVAGVEAAEAAAAVAVVEEVVVGVAEDAADLISLVNILFYALIFTHQLLSHQPVHRVSKGRYQSIVR